MKTTIRIMGDKEISEKILFHIVRLLETLQLDFSAPKEYPMYKDKKRRKEIDKTKTRYYITIYSE